MALAFKQQLSRGYIWPDTFLSVLGVIKLDGRAGPPCLDMLLIMCRQANLLSKLSVKKIQTPFICLSTFVVIRLVKPFPEN